MNDDLISRQAAIDALEWGNEWEVMDFTVIDKDDAIHQIKALPSAQQWIPCSERLPKKGRYLVTGRKSRDWYTSDKIVTSAFYDGEFWTDNGDIQAEAWMPLPKPYKADMRGESHE